MFLSYSYLYTTSILHPSYLLNPTNLSNLSTQPYLNLCPFLLKNYPRYVPLYAYRGFESSGQIYFHFMKSSILKTFTTSLSRYQHNTLHMARHRKHIYRLYLLCLIAQLGEQGYIPGQGCRVAGDVDDAPRLHVREGFQDGWRTAGARRIDDYDIGTDALLV